MIKDLYQDQSQRSLRHSLNQKYGENVELALYTTCGHFEFNVVSFNFTYSSEIIIFNFFWTNGTFITNSSEIFEHMMNDIF